MKKSLVMLVALFVLSACSTVNNNDDDTSAVVHADWLTAVKGENALFDGVSYGMFSDDVETFTTTKSDYYDEGLLFEIVSSTESTGQYYYKDSDNEHYIFFTIINDEVTLFWTGSLENSEWRDLDCQGEN